MATVFGGAKPSAKDVEQLRMKRQQYLDFLTNKTTQTNTEVNKKQLTPEGGNAILKVIKDAQDWLAKNPNADLNTVLAQQEKTRTEINRIAGTDNLKKKMQIYFTMVPVVAKKTEQKGLITPEITKKLVAIAKEAETWYNKNKDKATIIEFNQKFDEFSRVKTQGTGISAKAREYYDGELQRAYSLSLDDVAKLREKDQVQLQNAEDQTVDVNKGLKQVLSTATTTFWAFLLVGILIMCGSFAANMAIGRPPAYRILYFLWGAFPLFAPMVLLYTIYRRIRDGRLSMYAILPVSIEPATTTFGRFLWYPFYYVPDDQQTELYKQFQEALKAAASP